MNIAVYPEFFQSTFFYKGSYVSRGCEDDIKSSRFSILIHTKFFLIINDRKVLHLTVRSCYIHICHIIAVEVNRLSTDPFLPINKSTYVGT